MAGSDLVLGITGASGMPYAVRLLEVLLASGRTVHLTLSPAAVQVLQSELGRQVDLDRFQPEGLLGPRAAETDLTRLRYHHYRDFRAGIASGSFLTAGMVICPCSISRSDANSSWCPGKPRWG
jgi:4-hydroxy-3-polyprenylbenzoate decarboxylase